MPQGQGSITLPAETKLKSMFVCLFFKSQMWALVNVPGSLNLFCNGRGIFSFARHTVSVATSRFSSHSTKAAIDNTLMNGRVCVSITLDSQTLKFVFNIIFICHTLLLFGFLPPSI